MEPESGGGLSYDYPEMSSDLLPGSSTAGVITFPPLNSKQGLTLHFKGSSENYDIGDYRTLAWVFSW